MDDLVYPSARCPGRSVRDILLADQDNTPPVLLEEHAPQLGDETIGYARYTDQSFFDREMDRLWPRTWHWACRVEQVPEVGDYLVYDVGHHSILIVRDAEGIRAFRNACMHRATQLRPPESRGHAKSFRCPFHGWTYGLDGTLVDVPCAWDFPGVGTEHGLEPVRCDVWGGFVFINIDGRAESLATYMAPLDQHFSGRWDPSKRAVYLHIVKELPSNWKACLEAFMEAYHVFETHAQYLSISSDANAQYDIFGNHVSRFINPTGVPSPHVTKKLTEREILQSLMLAPGQVDLAPGETARSAAARAFRTALGQQWNVDLSDYSTSEMLDSIEYFLFPNTCIFPGVSLNMVYRFRPSGGNVGRTVFDLMLLRPLPQSGPTWESPEPIMLASEQSFTEAPGLAAGFAEVFDQDVGNLVAQWNGFLSKDRTTAQTLGIYQESRIRHFEQTVDKYINI